MGVRSLKGTFPSRRATALAAVVVSLVVVVLLPDFASAKTFSQVRDEVRQLHLAPPPLFPSQLPAAHRGVNVQLYRLAGLEPAEYVVDLGAQNHGDCHTLVNPNGWCVELRWSTASVDSWLNEPGNPAMYLRRVHVGHRDVWFFEAGGGAGGWWMVWPEDGRTYAAWAWTDEHTALGRLTPFVESLSPLSAPSPKPGYVAIGDSYSSGEANPPFMEPNTGCDRSVSGAWPELLAQATKIRMQALLACSGATTSALTSSFKGMAPQLLTLSHLAPKPNLITVTIGGNDLGFADVLTNCYLATCSTALAGVEGAFAGGFGRRMTATYRAISRTVPRARVVVVGYPQILPSDPLTALRHCPWLKDPADPVLMRKVTAQLNGVLSRAAKTAGVNYVSTLDALKGHELCTAHSWLRAIGLTGGNSRGHPTARGQAALASEVAKYVKSHHLA